MATAALSTDHHALSSQPPMHRRRRRSQPLKPRLGAADAFVSPHIAMLDGVVLHVSTDDSYFVLTTTSTAPQHTADANTTATTTTADTTTSSQRFTFDELRALKKRLLAALQRGHLCRAACPWTHSFLETSFPKKTTLTLSTDKRMRKRRDAIALCLTHVLQFVQNKENQSCAVVMGGVAQELAGALFGYSSSDALTASYSVQLLTASSTPSETRGGARSFSSLSSLSSLSESDTDDDELRLCQICQRTLEQQQQQREQEPKRPLDSASKSDERVDLYQQPRQPSCAVLRSPGLSSDSRWQRSSFAHYTTTLGCGHCFHDECILPVLNATQRCPTCNHIEIP